MSLLRRKIVFLEEIPRSFPVSLPGMSKKIISAIYIRVQ